jgi:DNA repair protein RadD
MLNPRPYQKRAIAAAIDWMRKNADSCVLDLSMSAGKSIIAAFIANTMHKISGGKKVLVLCPNATLVKQNAEKYAMISDEYSIYSASIEKSLRNPVVFATPLSFIGIVDQTNGEFCCVIVDEGDGITETIKSIISVLREKNPLLRLCSMTGTPYRTGEGWIAEIDADNSIIDEVTNPYYKKIVERVTPKELIDLGFATPPKVINVFEKYDTSKLKLGSGGGFRKQDIDEAFIGQGRKTAAIVEDIINYSNAINARGVMIFAATIQHCKEVMDSLPNYNSGVINGQMGDKHNQRVIEDFRNQKIRYLVNVNMATVGFSVDHVDIIAILRATESSRLYQQILGRGMRLDPHKKEFLLLDYTDNIEKLFPSGDVFSPEIVAYGKKPQPKHSILCPECNNQNEVVLRPLPTGYTFNEFGYILDLAGDIVLHETEAKPFPAHFSRRCSHIEIKGHNVFERCNYFWSFKECSECGHKNDLTARRCEACSHEMINPNDKLIADFQAFKKDLSQVQTDDITFIRRKETKSKSTGQPMLAMSFGTESRIVQAFFSNKVQKKFYDLFLNDPQYSPKTVTYKKSSSGYMHIYDFNRESDKAKFERELGK